jgi:hypothetical protein
MKGLPGYGICWDSDYFRILIYMELKARLKKKEKTK